MNANGQGKAAPRAAVRRARKQNNGGKAAVAKEVKKEVKQEIKREKRAVLRKTAPHSVYRAAQGMDGGLGPASQALNAFASGKTLPKHVLDVFNTVAAPGTGKAVRIGDEFGSRPTGVCSLYERTDTSFPIGGQSFIGNYSGQLFAFRSALRFSLFAVSEQEYYAQPGYNYSSIQPTKVATTGSESFFQLPLNNDPTTAEIGPHGEVLYPGRLGPSDPHYGYLANDGDTARITNLSGLPGQNYLVTMYVFDKCEWSPITSGTMSGSATLNFGIPYSGYYSFGVRVPVAGPGASFVIDLRLELLLGRVATEPRTIYWVQRALPDFNRNVDTIQNVKFHGVSAMWTNTTPMLTKGGQIAMMQIPAKSWWGDYTGYDNVAARNTRVNAQLSATDGAYLFLKPSRVTDFDFLTEFVPTNAVATGNVTMGQSGPTHTAWFYILPESDFITISLNLVDLAGPAGYWTVRTDIEYSSVDQWRNLVPPDINNKVLDEALPLIAAAPQFHTNDFHLSDLWDWLKGAASKVANAITEYGPSVLKAAAIVAPLLL